MFWDVFRFIYVKETSWGADVWGGDEGRLVSVSVTSFLPAALLPPLMSHNGGRSDSLSPLEATRDNTATILYTDILGEASPRLLLPIMLLNLFHVLWNVLSCLSFTNCPFKGHEKMGHMMDRDWEAEPADIFQAAE